MPRNPWPDQIGTGGRITPEYAAWQKTTGYIERSRVEAQIGRYKSVIGRRLHGRNLEAQQTETAIGVKALNRMTRIGSAVYQRVS